MCWPWQLRQNQSSNPCAGALHHFPHTAGIAGIFSKMRPPPSRPVRAQCALPCCAGVCAADKWGLNIPTGHGAKSAESGWGAQSRAQGIFPTLPFALLLGTRMGTELSQRSDFICFCLIILHSFSPTVTWTEERQYWGTSLPSLPAQAGGFPQFSKVVILILECSFGSSNPWR